MVNLSFHLLRTVQPVKHLSPAEIEATSKILLGALGIDRAWEYWRVRAGFSPNED
jgi:hypothetical protein